MGIVESVAQLLSIMNLSEYQTAIRDALVAEFGEEPEEAPPAAAIAACVIRTASAKLGEWLSAVPAAAPLLKQIAGLFVQCLRSDAYREIQAAGTAAIMDRVQMFRDGKFTKSEAIILALSDKANPQLLQALWRAGSNPK